MLFEKTNKLNLNENFFRQIWLKMMVVVIVEYILAFLCRCR